MSIEKDIHFIAESIEWQNKLLKKLFLENETDNSSNESKSGDNESCDDDSATDQI